MKIGIIGTGNIGGTLTRRFRALGHDVSIANSRGPQSLADLAAETGANAVSVREAARAGDVVVVTIPEKNIPDLPAGLFEGVPGNVVVVDTGNYYPRQRDGRIAAIEDGMTESRWVEQQLHRPVIKAFNNIYAQHLMDLGKPAGAPGLIEQLGFDAVDAGGLDESWRQQPGTPLYTKDLDAEGVRRALAEASKERTPEWRATAQSPGTFIAPA